ncbi:MULTISPECIES: hypothetical protein [Thermus]|nr:MULTISPECIES: hypothetical protein [Thermus]MBW6395852.1 hypothetical protein [Thermus brevis]UZX16131.1 hypothetical protein KQ693_03635 [Thermus sp. PS18]
MRLVLTLGMGLLAVGLFGLGGAWSLLGVLLFFLFALLFDDTDRPGEPENLSPQA